MGHQSKIYGSGKCMHALSNATTMPGSAERALKRSWLASARVRGFVTLLPLLSGGLLCAKSAQWQLACCDGNIPFIDIPSKPNTMCQILKEQPQITSSLFNALPLLEGPCYALQDKLCQSYNPNASCMACTTKHCCENTGVQRGSVGTFLDWTSSRDLGASRA